MHRFFKKILHKIFLIQIGKSFHLICGTWVPKSNFSLIKIYLFNAFMIADEKKWKNLDQLPNLSFKFWKMCWYICYTFVVGQKLCEISKTFCRYWEVENSLIQGKKPQSYSNADITHLLKALTNIEVFGSTYSSFSIHFNVFPLIVKQTSIQTTILASAR